MSVNPYLRNETGTYLLVMQSSVSYTVEVGAKGTILLREGTYLYVGSAFGAGGVEARVRRHARTDHAKHWHIDYIRPHCTLQGACISYADTKLECLWARTLLDMACTSAPGQGIGSSDCDCPAHFMQWEAEASAQDKIGKRLRNIHLKPVSWTSADEII